MSNVPPSSGFSSQVSAEQLATAERLIAEQQSIYELFLAAQRSRKEYGVDAAEVGLKGFLQASAAYKTKLSDFNQRYGPFGDPAPIVNAQVSSLTLLGEMAEQDGRLADAHSYYDAASDLAAAELSPVDRIEAELRLANARAAAGQFHIAITALHEARDELEQLDIDGDASGKLRDLRFSLTDRLSEIYEWLGDLERAEQEVRLAEELLRPAGGDARLPDAFGGLDPRKEEDLAKLTELVAEVSRGMAPGQTDEAEALFAALQQLEGQTTHSQQSLNLKLRKGLLDRKARRFEDAHAIFEEIAPEYAAMGEAAGLGIEYQLAALEREAGDPHAALDRLKLILSRIEDLPELRWKAGPIVLTLAECQRDLGDGETALENVDIAIDEMESRDQRDSLWKAYWLKAQLLEDNPQTSLLAYDRAIGIVDELRQAPFGFRLDSVYLADKRPLFEEAILAAATENNAEAACRFMEAAKSRTLITLLSVLPENTEHDPSHDPVITKIDALSREIDALEWQSYAGDEPSAQRDDLIARRRALLERKLISDPRWRMLRQRRSLDLEALQSALLKRDLAAIDLFLIRDSIVAVLITGVSARVAVREISKKTRRLIDVYGENLTSPSPDPLAQDPLTLGLGLMDLLPEDIVDETFDHDRCGLVISPHRELHLLPWAGFPYDAARVFDKVAVSILPNLSCLPILMTTEDEPSAELATVSLFGAPDYSGLRDLKDLPEAAAEIADIEKLYERADRLAGASVTGRSACEAAFWDLLSGQKPNILHVCCHANAVPDAPMSSGLICVDGKIDAAEIAASRLPCREVVLSACSTGYRPSSVGNLELHGDDILGLPGSFFEAGATSILVSIPLASDAAARAFSIRYHKARLSGKSQLIAYQDTQKFMASEAKHDPMSWVGFVLYGGLQH